MDATDATLVEVHPHKGRRHPHISQGVEPSVLIGRKAITAYAGAVPIRCEAVIAYARMAGACNAYSIDFFVSSSCVDIPKRKFSRWLAVGTKRTAHWKLFQTRTAYWKLFQKRTRLWKLFHTKIINLQGGNGNG